MFLSGAPHSRSLIEYTFIICFVAIIVDAYLIEDGLEVFYDLGRRLQSLDQLCDEILGLLTDLGLVLGALEFAPLDLLLLAYDVYVVDGVDDLSDLLLVLVVPVDLVLEVLLESRVLLVDPLQLHLQTLHLPLLVIECVLKLPKLLSLILTSFLHLLINLHFSFHELIVFSL